MFYTCLFLSNVSVFVNEMSYGLIRKIINLVSHVNWKCGEWIQKKKRKRNKLYNVKYKSFPNRFNAHWLEFNQF